MKETLRAADDMEPRSTALLKNVLRNVVRRYRLPELPLLSADTTPATALAITMETARACVDRNEPPGEDVKHRFLEALAQLIRNAIRAEDGDPAFQAMVLQHQAPQVREYASLSARIDQDRRLVHAAINSLAHPEKQKRASSTRQAEALGRLHAAAFSSTWAHFVEVAQRATELTEITDEPALAEGLQRLLDQEALARMRRHEDLEADELVQRYQALRDRNGPRSGSADAAAQGSASRKRGAAVEALAAQALVMLAQRLEQAEGTEGAYRVAESLRLPAALSGDSQRGKGEWDVALLRKAKAGDAKNKTDASAWSIALLVEAKASLDAATTDLPRLVRGLELLAQADGDTTYAFKAGRETLLLHGASLSALKTNENDLKDIVLYCCDAPVETTPRLLGPASRMQLLSAPAGLEFAARLAQGQPPPAEDLEAIWAQLLSSPQWRPVLHQYQTLRQVRELMVHPEDLIAQVSQSSTLI